MTVPAFEVNCDGLVGPTHNYAGLAFGNLASEKHAGRIANPRAAALEGLEKMRFLSALGLRQIVLPPQPRPHLASLRAVGFSGSDEDVIAAAARSAPQLLAQCYSVSAMWAANAATVSPSADTSDGRIHFTPANLVHNFHRSLETPFTRDMLRAVFASEKYFRHHEPLPAQRWFADEGAANHTRLAAAHGEPGAELFVYGFDPAFEKVVRKYPARQSLLASQAVARLHGLDPDMVFYAQQTVEAVDAGVFHNDVIAVGNEHVLFYHAMAFQDEAKLVAGMRKAVPQLCPIRVEAADVSLPEAVASYLFNSQLVTLPEGGMALVAPKECEEHAGVRSYLDFLRQDNGNPVNAVHYVDVRGSMNNGGGPACLRLRVVMTEAEWQAVHPGVVFTPALHETLSAWVRKHYRDRLAPQDLADPQLRGEAVTALEELYGLLHLPGLIPALAA